MGHPADFPDGAQGLWDIRLVQDDKARLPARVVAGDKVRLVSPASYPEPEWIAESVRILEGWGLIAEVAEHALARWGYLAGRDSERLADLNEAFRDPAMRAVITTRGGAGAYRIADDIDFDAIRADPKPVVGFSDITYLHLALWQHCRVSGIHGCLAGTTAISAVRQLLMTTDPLVLKRDTAAVSAAIHVGGRARGRLIGGNLTAVATSVGVRLPDLRGAILFLEAQREIGLGLVDRQLTQLVRSKALDDVAGIALGSFHGFGGLEDRGWTILDVLHDRLGSLGVPVLGGLFCGHDLAGADGRPDQSALSIGSMAVLDADQGSLALEPCVQ
jgi:muramoyltetrapeptide carboxypeptidase